MKVTGIFPFAHSMEWRTARFTIGSLSKNVLGDWLEGWVRRGVARTHQRDPYGARFCDGRSTRAVTGGWGCRAAAFRTFSLSHSVATTRSVATHMLAALCECGLRAIHAPAGAYYVLVDIAPFGWPDDNLFARELVRRVGVATVPGSSFFNEPRRGKDFIRLCFPKRRETIDRAAELLRGGLARMRTDIP